MQNTVKDIQDSFIRKRQNEEYVEDKTGVKTIEIINASFIANEPTIFGKINLDYVQRELDWYLSKSLNVNDIPGETPQIWSMISDDNGMIHSNYGYLTLSEENHNQFKNCVAELKKNPNSRRAVMVYTRPTIWNEYDTNGMSDFICTNAVQYLIRNGKLDVVVQMRSNDVVFGYRNDFAWQEHIANMVCTELGIKLGDIHWNVGSMHVYERHFKFIDAEIEKQNHIADRQFDEYASAARDWSNQVSKFYD